MVPVFRNRRNPLYQGIPFFVAAGWNWAAQVGSYGILLDNTWAQWFDFGKQDPKNVPSAPPAGTIDYT